MTADPLRRGGGVVIDAIGNLYCLPLTVTVCAAAINIDRVLALSADIHTILPPPKAMIVAVGSAPVSRCEYLRRCYEYNIMGTRV